MYKRVNSSFVLSMYKLGAADIVSAIKILNSLSFITGSIDVYSTIGEASEKNRKTSENSIGER